MIAVDTNVLIYAHRLETDRNAAATAELVRLAEGAEPWALPVFCLTEFMRVVTHRRVFNPPSTIAQAMDFINGIVAAPTCHVALPGADFLRHLETTVRRADARGNLMFDAQIAALCREHGIAAILTNDRDFERFDKLQVRYLDEVADHGDKARRSH